MKSQFARLRDEFFVEAHQRTVHEAWVTVPNMITFGGLLLTGLYVIQYMLGVATYLIPVTVVLVGVSDLLDGFLARRLDQHTTLGKWMDPVRDKALTFALLGNVIHDVVLTSRDPLLIALISIVVVAESIVFGLGAWRRLHGMEIRVHVLGKARQALNLLAIGGIIIELYWIELGISFPYLVGVMAVASMIGLVVYATRFLDAREGL